MVLSGGSYYYAVRSLRKIIGIEFSKLAILPIKRKECGLFYVKVKEEKGGFGQFDAGRRIKVRNCRRVRPIRPGAGRWMEISVCQGNRAYRRTDDQKKTGIAKRVGDWYNQNWFTEPIIDMIGNKTQKMPYAHIERVIKP